MPEGGQSCRLLSRAFLSEVTAQSCPQPLSGAQVGLSWEAGLGFSAWNVAWIAE